MPELVQYFSTVGEVKVDRNSKQPRVHLYKDKATGEPLGEATITYKDNQTQRTALETYNNQMYQVSYTVSLDLSPLSLLISIFRVTRSE